MAAYPAYQASFTCSRDMADDSFAALLDDMRDEQKCVLLQFSSSVPTVNVASFPTVVWSWNMSRDHGRGGAIPGTDDPTAANQDSLDMIVERFRRYASDTPVLTQT